MSWFQMMLNMNLFQNGTVTYYYLEFTALVNRYEGLSNEALLDCFISGMQDDIKRNVISMNPNTMVKALSLSKLFEERYSNTNKSNQNPYNTKTTYTNQNSSYTTKTDHLQNQNNPTLPPLLPTPASKPANTNTRNIAIKDMSAA